MSMRTKIPLAWARSRTAAMLSRQKESSMLSPIWVGLSETLAASECSVDGVDDLVVGGHRGLRRVARSLTLSPSTSSVAQHPSWASLWTVATASSSVAPAT